MDIRQQLTSLMEAAFTAQGYPAAYGVVTVSKRPDLCQFQCNGAMAAAKQSNCRPLEVAQELAARMAVHPEVAKARAVAPGFINLDVTDEFLTQTMRDMAADGRLGLPTVPHKTIVVDYGGPNLAKALHVGHLRTAIIGESLCRIARFLGNTVIGDAHFGDWGLQIGLVITSLRRRCPDLPYFDPAVTDGYPEEPPVTVDELNTLYPEASALSKTDPDFAAEAAAATVELQNGRPGYLALWKHIRQVSLDDLKPSYELLNVRFDQWLGESDADPYIPFVMERLRERGLLRQSEGATVVDVALPDDKEPMPPMIMVKSNGGFVYETTDLGTIWQRMEDWKPDEIWYVVDNRQAFHLKQVFRCATLAGMLGDTVCTHVTFGTMNGKDGKPYKTRDGGVMRLSDMIEMVTANAYARTQAGEVVQDEAQRRRVARQVGVAAMKVGDFVNHRSRDFVFDLDRFMASEGKTGPFLQYSTVRLQSVLDKADPADLDGALLPPAGDAERTLMLSMTTAGDALMRAYTDKAPSAVCEMLFDIAGAANRFYFENRILSCSDSARRRSWLALVALTHRMLTMMLDLLGIEVPEKM